MKFAATAITIFASAATARLAIAYVRYPCGPLPESAMPILRNLTLHTQGQREIEIAARGGFDLTTKPEGVEIPIDGTIEEAANLLAERLRTAAQSAEAVLVGGHTGLWIAAALALGSAGLPRMFYFETRRVHDEHERFIFTPERLIEVPVP